MPATKPRRRLTGYAILSLLFLLFLRISFGWSDVVLRPWAISLTGGPVLMDTWSGQLPLPGTAARPIVLELQRVPQNLYRGACPHCARIEGTARVCLPGTGVETFSVRGDVGNWRGTVFRLHAAAPQRSPGTYTNFGEIRGEWDRGDAIRLRTSTHPIVINNDGSSTVSSDGSPDPEVTFDLRRTADSRPPSCG